MLYSNIALKVVPREMKFGTVTGVAIGEYGRGRQEVFLPTPKSVQADDVIKGLCPDLTIGTSKSGRPRIDAREDDDIYLILSSKRDYTCRGDGHVKAPKSQEVELIARGRGADGTDGRIVGVWDAIIVKAKDGDVFRLTWGGSECSYDATFYVVWGGEVYSADQLEIEYLYDRLGLEIPFSLAYKREVGRLLITFNEWRTI